MNSAAYIDLLRTHVQPWIEDNYEPGSYVWRQDSAPAHTAQTTQNYLQQNFSDFWPKSVWPPGSPDLSPLNFAVWARVQHWSNAISHSNLNSLRRSVTAAWRKLDEQFIRTCCSSFRPRLEAVIAAEGGHIG